MTRSLDFLAAARDGDVARVRALAEASPALLGTRSPEDFADHALEGCSALHLAVHRDDRRLAELLVELGVDLDLRNRMGRTALHDAIEYGSSLAETLIERGAHVDVCAAAILGRHARLEELLDADPALVDDRSTEISPLCWAAFGDQVESARILIDRGARMDDGELLCAASVDHVDVGRFLIERGASADAIFEPCGRNALHECALMRYACDTRGFARLLLEAGATVDAPAADGRTVLEMAREGKAEQERGGGSGPKEYDGLIALLLEHGAG